MMVQNGRRATFSSPTLYKAVYQPKEMKFQIYESVGRTVLQVTFYDNVHWNNVHTYESWTCDKIN